MKFRFISAVSFLAASSAAVFACSSSSSGGTAGACQSYASALIGYQQRCTGAIDPNRQSEDTSRFVQLCEGALSLPGVKDISGQLSTCSSNLSGASCNQNVNQIPGCDIQGTGTLADGAACVIGEECQSGSCTITAASGTGDGGETLCGTCTPALADGADCSQGGSCVAGDTCKYSSGDGGSFTAICTKKPAPGDVGADCASSDDCTSPNHCDYSGGTSQTGKCAAPIASGGACVQSNSECADGLVCTGLSSRTCAPPVAEGGTCSGSDCAPGLACDFSTTKCVKIQFAAQGAACDDNTVRCSQGRCVQEATSGGGPGGGTGTGSLSGTCPTIIADGQPCTGSSGTSQCDDYASCIEGKCAFVPAACK